MAQSPPASCRAFKKIDLRYREEEPMNNPRHNTRDVRAPRGPEITARSWMTEAPMRMLMNNLDAEVAERPHELVIYGQMTAGSWIYIGTQGIVQGTYETFVEAGRQHYDGNLRGKWILTGGLGGMGGAQPLAAVMAGACCLAVECDETRIDFRLRTRYVDEKATSLDEALAMIDKWTKAGEAKSVGLL